MKPNQPNYPLNSNKTQLTKDSFYDPHGGLDPVLVELSDVLPAEVFEKGCLD